MALRQRERLFQYRGHVQTVAPATEPVTAAELRTHLRETATGLPDSEAEDFIAQAREMIEEATGLALINQTWRMALDSWPPGNEPWWDGVRDGAISEMHGHARSVRLPRHPLSSITSVTTYDESGASTALTVSTYFDVDTYQKPGRLNLKNAQTWPAALRDTNAIEIVYVAGYGASASAVPAALRGAVKQIASYLYSHRGDDCDPGDALAGVKNTLDRYRVVAL